MEVALRPAPAVDGVAEIVALSVVVDVELTDVLALVNIDTEDAIEFAIPIFWFVTKMAVSQWSSGTDFVLQSYIV